MNSVERAAELRALADSLDVLAELETSAAAAKQAYRDDPSDANRDKHRDASTALNQARDAIRVSKVLVATNEPGSATVVPSAVRPTRRAADREG